MRFKNYREAVRLSPSQAAKQIGVMTSTIWRWERGKSRPTRHMQLLISDWSRGAVTPNDWPDENAEAVFRKVTGRSPQAVFGHDAVIERAEHDTRNNMIRVLVNLPVSDVEVEARLNTGR